MEELRWTWGSGRMDDPQYRYGRLECIKSDETIAYVDRRGYIGKMHNEAVLFLLGVFTLWSVSESEVETYGIAFGSLPVIHVSDIAVLSLGWTLSEREETDKGPWLWEF